MSEKNMQKGIGDCVVCSHLRFFKWHVCGKIVQHQPKVKSVSSSIYSLLCREVGRDTDRQDPRYASPVVTGVSCAALIMA